MNRLTDKELLLTSECILKAMESMEEAKRHIVGPELVKALDIKMAELKALNYKVLAEIVNSENEQTKYSKK